MHARDKTICIQSGTLQVAPPWENGHVLNSGRGTIAESRRKRDRSRACTATLTAGIPVFTVPLNLSMDMYKHTAVDYSAASRGWALSSYCSKRQQTIRRQVPGPGPSQDSERRRVRQETGAWASFFLSLLAWLSKKGRVKKRAGSGLGAVLYILCLCGVYTFFFCKGSNQLVAKVSTCKY